MDLNLQLCTSVWSVLIILHSASLLFLCTWCSLEGTCEAITVNFKPIYGNAEVLKLQQWIFASLKFSVSVQMCTNRTTTLVL